MLSIKHGLALLSTVAALGLPTAMSAPVSQGRGTTDDHVYTAKQKEFYLTAEEKHYIRPGLTVTVDDLSINGANQVVVALSFYDDQNQPLDRAGETTPGPISVSFILAWYDGEARHYTAYTTREATSDITGETATQASSDSGGAWEDLEVGRARYTFGTALPDGYDSSKTHSVAFYATRDTTEMIGKRYYSNVVHDFRPDGGDMTEQWAKITTATCNTCHDQLALHGERRRDLKLCATCHSPQSVDPDTGNTVDLKVMIHKIHRGADLPSVEAGTPYQIIGFRGSVHDYSEVIMPRDIRDCANCHRPDIADSAGWMTNPSRAACGSCHDNINWVTGEGHVLPQLDDSACAACHQPEGSREFDTSIMGAHTIPVQSEQLAGLMIEIIDVADAFPGGFPSVTFQVTNGDGSVVDPSTLNRLRFTIGGPTTDYTGYFREDALDAEMVGDLAVKTLTTPLPDDATGSWAFSADVYRNVMIDAGSDEIEVREAALNPIHYVELSPAKALQERRQVVSLDKCNVCHGRLSLHGGQRLAIETCIICHNPGEDDSGRRPDEEMPAESVHFKRLIHRIHTGLELDNDFTVYGFGSNAHNYNDVGYPGDRRNCESCHLSGTYSVPLPEGALETPTLRDYYTPMQPGASACLSCHSSVDAAAHAYTNTAPFGESCAACHGDNREFSVEQVHAR